MVSATPDKGLIRLYALAWLAGYWVVYFAFRDLLPEKAMTDALYILQAIGGGIKGELTQGYAAMVQLFSLLPGTAVWILVGLFDGYILYRVASCARTFRGMALLPIALIPFITLNLQAPTKETLVLLLALLILTIANRVKTEGKIFWGIVIVYTLYGLMVRDYYLLILAAFAGYMAILKTTPFLRWVYILPLIVVLLVMPESGYHLLGDSRNEVNFLVNFGEASEVRTYFMNPFPSDSMTHFIGNYLNAFAMLHFPFLKAMTLKEVIMLLNVLLYGTMMVVGIRKLQGPQRVLSLLFAAHVTILIIFEPDYGSYMRHFGSVTFYLLPPLIYLEERRAALLQAQATRPETTAP